MNHVFHTMKIDHPPNNIINNLEYFIAAKSCFFIMELIKEASIFKKLCDQLILVYSDTHPHIQNNIRVFKIAQNIDLFHKIFSIFMILPGFHIIFDGYWSRHVFTPIDLTISPNTYLLYNLNIPLFDDKI